MSGNNLAKELEECTERCRSLDAPLAVRLQSFADDVRKLSPEFADIVERMIARLKNAETGQSAPKPGEPMPFFMLPDQDGRLVTLDELTKQGQVVLAFHRGHWCPYCRINADALRAIQDEIKSLNAALVAITPETEDFNTELGGKQGDRMRVLSDINNGYALLLNLAFYVGDEKQQAMMDAGWDISEFQGDMNWTLPIPATFVIGEDGIIKARFIDPDYRRRMDTDEILAALRT